MSRIRRTSSLLSRGEPMAWVTGAGLALALLMIVGLLALILVRGLATFWPAAVVRMETGAGEVVLGEVARTERHTPEGSATAVRRRLVRTGNFELSGRHFAWVSDSEIRSESRPAWAVVVERLTWGRFYGTPQRFLKDGQAVASTPPEIWKLFGAYHDEVRQRWRARVDLERDGLGPLSREREAARLALRGAARRHGARSAAARAARAELARTTHRTEQKAKRIRTRIDALKRENDRYRIVLRTAAGREKSLSLAAIVRAYPANRLSVGRRIGIYLSRWWEFLWDEPREANSEGGVFPALFGTIVMVLLMSLLVAPFGVLAALYLREYAHQGFFVGLVRIAVNNLAGVPSIVFGVFGLGFFCYVLGASIDTLFFSARLPNPTFGKGGLLWAALTLALLTLPVVIVATEEALAAVPRSMREGSYACGASKWQTIRNIVLPRAMPGILTGMILALARGAGEVAPLMLVGAAKLAPQLPIDASFPFVHPERSFMHLGFHIYDLGFQSQNSEAAKPMVFTTTLLLLTVIVALNLLAIRIRGRLRRAFQSS